MTLLYLTCFFCGIFVPVAVMRKAPLCLHFSFFWIFIPVAGVRIAPLGLIFSFLGSLYPDCGTNGSTGSELFILGSYCPWLECDWLH